MLRSCQQRGPVLDRLLPILGVAIHNVQVHYLKENSQFYLSLGIPPD